MRKRRLFIEEKRRPPAEPGHGVVVVSPGHGPPLRGVSSFPFPGGCLPSFFHRPAFTRGNQRFSRPLVYPRLLIRPATSAPAS
jgi:hypothetical protein